MNVLLLNILNNPARSKELTLADWDVLVPQARTTGLLATMGLLLQECGALAEIPEVVRRHIESVIWIHRKQCENLHYEIKWLRRAMDGIDGKLVILKGGAYILAGLPAASGRLVSDIDLLVPQASLESAEAAFRRYGWESAEDDPYNERYYRQWMHEIPPMVHPDRDSVIDVHHTILPPTADEKLDPDKLFDDLTRLDSGIYVLSPLDMVLHSATHLFHEGEFTHGLRDLLDLDRLMRDLAAADDEFWDKLAARAREMGMLNSLYYALRYARLFFHTPVPDAVFHSVEAATSRFPGTAVMDFLFRRGFLPDHPSCTLPFTGLARSCLYLRSHYLRMPLYLLVPHLVRKAWMAQFGGPASDDDLQPEQK